jgi:acetyl-CoA carboxylase biotin carboxyl carrier protein
MWTSKIRKLVKLVNESNIGELELSEWGQKVRITKYAPETPEVRYVEKEVLEKPPEPEQVTALSKEKTYIKIESPMVGTFYRAPEQKGKEEVRPYVELNQNISPGDVVCRIEAMKLQHEIETEKGGRIEKILVENGKPVEFGQILFLIEPKA